MPAAPFPVAQRDRRLTLFAWAVTALISILPEILFNEFGQTIPNWLTTAKMGLLAVLALISLYWPRLAGLRAFFIAMLAFFAFSEARLRIDFTLPWLQKLFGSTAFDARMQAEQTGKLALSLAMILILLQLGFKRREFFLTRGAWRTPITPVRWLGFPKADAWPVFGLQWGFYIALGLAAAQYFFLRPDGVQLRAALSMLPSILFYAALNAFNEEMTFRAPMLATLEPTGGSLHAWGMSAYFFGIAHYFGTPGGLAGAVLSIFMGWMLGKAMLETRGLLWAWWMHFLSDVAIFSFLAMSLN